MALEFARVSGGSGPHVSQGARRAVDLDRPSVATLAHRPPVPASGDSSRGDQLDAEPAAISGRSAERAGSFRSRPASGRAGRLRRGHVLDAPPQVSGTSLQSARDNGTWRARRSALEGVWKSTWMRQNGDGRP